jgi:hypothetical protein
MRDVAAPERTEPLAYLSAYVAADLKERLAERAHQNMRTVSGELRFILVEALAEPRDSRRIPLPATAVTRKARCNLSQQATEVG